VKKKRRNFDVEDFWRSMYKITKKICQKITKHETVRKFQKSRGKQKSYHFQLFGLDFLLDDNGKVFLTECNTRPGIDWTPEKERGIEIPRVKEGNKVTTNVFQDMITLLNIDSWEKRGKKLPFIPLHE